MYYRLSGVYAAIAVSLNLVFIVALMGMFRSTLTMPGIAGLEDNMPEAEFRRRYGGVGSPAYNNVIEEITRRILALELYR